MKLDHKTALICIQHWLRGCTITVRFSIRFSNDFIMWWTQPIASGFLAIFDNLLRFFQDSYWIFLRFEGSVWISYDFAGFLRIFWDSFRILTGFSHFFKICLGFLTIFDDFWRFLWDSWRDYLKSWRDSLRFFEILWDSC